jgi:regulator of protease activity HflC (stomatin/prohibitin superfamily)
MLGVAAVIVALLALSGIKIVREYERAVIFRLGRLTPPRGPGLIFVIPLVEEMYRTDLRTITLDVPAQDVISRDNVSVKVNAVLYFRIVDPNRAVVDVQNFLYATSQIAQTTLRSVCGQAHLDELLAEREKFNARLQDTIDQHTEPWGVKVVAVEVKHIDLPIDMQRSIARQAEAERLRRAKVINAEGEFQAAARLAEAASIMEGSGGVSIQLRMLQALSQIGKEKNRTIIVPLPIDLIQGIFARWLGSMSRTGTGTQVVGVGGSAKD